MRAPIYSSNPNELFEPATISNPQPLYARLRSETPLSRIADSGVHLVATWDLIDEALARESDFSANLTGVLMRTPGDPSIFATPEVDGGVIATADEPLHSIHRGILQSRFSTQSVATLEAPVVHKVGFEPYSMVSCPLRSSSPRVSWVICSDFRKATFHGFEPGR